MSNSNKKILFISGTRADYGKIKSLMTNIKSSPNYELLIFVTGMHTLSKYGLTFTEIEKDGFDNIYTYINQNSNTRMDIALSNTILGLSNYVQENKPDLIVIHGDRIEALAGAIVGALNNIRVAHIEGGELSGTIDESIRHAITKFSHYHFVSNKAAEKRIVQLGEDQSNIYVIGSPDIDIMFSNKLPSLIEAKSRYDIDFESYSIVLYHPVTTELDDLKNKAQSFVDGLIATRRNYIVISPNNDHGSELIDAAYNNLSENSRFKLFPSVRFEYFLTLLKHSDFIIGNSSSGVREAHIYKVPAINVGSRQNGRVEESLKSDIINVDENVSEIIEAVGHIDTININSPSVFGNGNSADKFMQAIDSKDFWDKPYQKKFYDIN